MQMIGGSAQIKVGMGHLEVNGNRKRRLNYSSESLIDGTPWFRMSFSYSTCTPLICVGG